MLTSFTNLARAGSFGASRLMITRSIFFRDKKSEDHPPEPFKSSIPPHLVKQQEKALEEYKTNEDPSLKCYGKDLRHPVSIYSRFDLFSEHQ